MHAHYSLCLAVLLLLMSGTARAGEFAAQVVVNVGQGEGAIRGDDHRAICI